MVSMKSLLLRVTDSHSESGVELQALVGRLFRCYPALYGFSVQPIRTLPDHRKAVAVTGDLVVADVEFNPWSDREPPEQMLGFIANALFELIEECPDADELLRGRTFARELH